MNAGSNGHAALIQIADDPKTGDPSLAEFLGFGAPFSAGQFVSITDAGGRSYLGLIEVAALNLNRNALATYSNATLNQFESLLRQRMSRDAIVNECRLYRIRYIKAIDATGQSGSVRIRSSIGSEAALADEDAVVSALNLPRATDATTFGRIMDTDIRLALNQKILVNHMVVAGTTGSGKSNLIANVIAAAQALGFFVVVYDHKPDYCRADQANDEPGAFRRRPISDVEFWTLGGGRGESIALPANVLDPTVLSYTIFHRGQTEANQAEETERLLEHFIEDWGGSNKDFGLDDFHRWLNGPTADNLRRSLKISTATFEAIYRKVGRPARRPGWIWQTASAGILRPDRFDIEALAGPGQVLVIDVGSGHGLVGRSYALFLSYALRAIGAIKRRSFPVLHVIDEAQDIFGAGREFREAAGLMMNNFIRKGRSQKIGFLIGVQSAEALPEDVRNNMNTEVIFRHKRPEQVKEATASLSRDQAVQTATFGAGECFVSMLGAGAVVHCQAFMSPFRLPREDD